MDGRMRAQGCGDVPRVAPGSPHPPSLLHARACSAALFTKSLEMRRRFFNDYLLREIALSQHVTGFPVHVCMFAAEVRSTKSPNSAREPALTCHLPASSLPGALLPSGTAAAAQGQINVLLELNGAVLLQLPCDVLSQMSFAHG